MMTEKQAKQLIALMALHWPNYPFAPESWKAYQRGLDDVTYADAERAVDIATKTEVFCPVVAVLRNILGANADIEVDAEAAWADVKEQIRVAGIYQTPRFADPATDQAVRAMGWPGLCTMLISQEMTHRKHFMDIFRSMKRRANQQAVRDVANGVTPIGVNAPKKIAG